MRGSVPNFQIGGRLLYCIVTCARRIQIPLWDCILLVIEVILEYQVSRNFILSLYILIDLFIFLYSSLQLEFEKRRIVLFGYFKVIFSIPRLSNDTVWKVLSSVYPMVIKDINTLWELQIHEIPRYGGATCFDF